METAWNELYNLSSAKCENRSFSGKVNMLQRLLPFLIFLVAAVPASASTSEQSKRVATKLFKKAFQRKLPTKKRLARIRQVARDHTETRWGDDALWVLARVADARGNPARSVVIRQQLLDRKGSVHLEPFTQNQKLFRTSRIYQLQFLLERSGHIYEGIKANAKRFDVVSLALHDQLGWGYEQLKMPRSAAREYRRALHLAPGKFLRKQYQKRLKYLVKKFPERMKKGDEAKHDHDTPVSSTETTSEKPGKAPPGNEDDSEG